MSSNNNYFLNGLNPLSYMGVNPYTPAPFFSKTTDPTTRDAQNFILGTIWLNTTNFNIWFLVSLAKGSATWIQLASGVGDLLTLTGNTEGAVYPLLGNINIIGGPTDTIFVTGDPANNTLDIDVSGGTDGQVIIGSTTGAVAWANITSNGGTIAITNGANSINLETGAAELATLTVDKAVVVTPDAGNITMTANTTAGSSVSFVGNSPAHTIKFSVTDVNLNTIIGNSSGNNSITSNGNTSLGYGIFPELTDGFYNTVIGYGSGAALTSGDANTIIGASSGTGITTGESNILIGNGAGSAYVTGDESNNIILGPSTGTNNTSGELWIGDFTNTTTTYVAGTYGKNPSGTNEIVSINSSNGQLGSFTLTDVDNNIALPYSGTIQFLGAGNVSIAASGNTLTFTGTGGGGGSPLSFFGTSPSNSIILTGGSGTSQLAVFGSATGTKANLEFSIPCAGTISNLYVNIGTSNTGSAAKITINKNGANTSVVATIAAATTGVFTDLTHSFTVSAGDTIQFERTDPGSGTASGTISAQFSSSGGGGSGVSGLQDADSNIAGPNGSGNILILGGSGINTVASAVDNSVTISLTGTSTYTYTNVSTSPYVVETTDQYLSVDCSSIPITLQFPDAATAYQAFIVKDRTGNAGTNNIVITTVSGLDPIDGTVIFTMNTNYQSVQLIGNGSGYEIF